MVQSLAVPKPDSSLSAVVVSGGKQYRVAPGDKILVDRLTAEPGSSLKLGRVLLLRNGDDITVGSPGVDGLDVEVKVLQHRRGPRLESIRYKSKKRVRVHHGGRADLTALEIIAVGGFTGETKTKEEPAEKLVTQKALGLDLATLSKDLRTKYKIKDTVKGVIVTGVDGNSDAAEKRLSAGDVIVEVAQEAVGNAADVKKRVDQLKKDGKKSVLLLVANGDGELRFVALSVQ